MLVVRHIDSPSMVARPGVERPRSENDHPEDWLTVGEAILLAVRGSATRKDAAEFAGVSAAAVTRWVQRGITHMNELYETGRDEPDPSEAPYVELATKIVQVEAAARVSLVADIRKAVRKEWRAGAWLMEHRGGAEWAPPSRAMNVHVEQGGTATIGAIPTDDEIGEIEANARQRALMAGDIVDVQEATG